VLTRLRNAWKKATSGNGAVQEKSNRAKLGATKTARKPLEKVKKSLEAKSVNKETPTKKVVSVRKSPLVKKVTRVRQTKKTKPATPATKELSRSEANPIIEPNRENSWESWQTFNPAAIQEDGKVHLLYRAIGEGGYSALGYANSEDGHVIKERHPLPAFVRRNNSKKIDGPPILTYGSGGGWNGGSEDPRLTKLDDNLYLIYTAFDGWASLRLALTSIPTEDFINKNWNWKDPVFISPPMEIHKNWVLFPEKVNGKFAILHGIDPEILIDYFDDLNELDGKTFIKSAKQYGTVKNRWDSTVRGVGPPPIKTENGWLILYHAIDQRDPGRYKLGAMLLDLRDPTKILHRSNKPILEPDEAYENNGKPGVIYSCGAVVMEGTLFVYYGGADAVTCVATADLKKFVTNLSKDIAPKLKRGSPKKQSNGSS